VQGGPDRVATAMRGARRFVVIASASGSGKTTLGRLLAARLGIPFIELDALVHGPGWRETADEVLRNQVQSIIARSAWVIDGMYSQKLGSMALDAAEVVIWLDVPLWLCLVRLVRRSVRRWRGHQALWNGNRESLAGLIGGRQSLFGHALGSHGRRRRALPQQLARYRVVRLRSPRDIGRWLSSVS
jgi:hypothetical protein